jgi:hypothetical protein
MNKFKFWYLTNQTKICWFFNGWLALNCINSLGRGDYISAGVGAGLIWLNIALNR